MELKVTTLEGKEAGSVQLSDEIFGLEPRKDIIQRCVQWQLNKRQAGTHKTKGRAEIWRTGKKMYKQKGTGGARHGSARVPQFRGGGRAFGPVVRSHATDLPGCQTTRYGAGSARTSFDLRLQDVRCRNQRSLGRIPIALEFSPCSIKQLGQAIRNQVKLLIGSRRRFWYVSLNQFHNQFPRRTIRPLRIVARVQEGASVGSLISVMES